MWLELAVSADCQRRLIVFHLMTYERSHRPDELPLQSGTWNQDHHRRLECLDRHETGSQLCLRLSPEQKCYTRDERTVTRKGHRLQCSPKHRYYGLISDGAL